MAKIAFILLCHKDPAAIIQQAERLTAAGDYMSIHFDARSPNSDFQAIKDALGGNPNVTFSKKRLRCGWGEWSLVAATTQAMRAALEAFPRATHFYMLSGDCMAIKPSNYAHALLDDDDVDYIESFDYFDSDWIKTGFKKERLIYRHLFNERKSKRLFYAAFELQKRFGLHREIPSDLQIMIGSQWWCLRRKTVEAVLDFSDARSDVTRFFKTTWIPDETFFQTLVRHLIPSREIKTHTLTFLMFTDYGMPVTFYNDHYDLLLSQDFLFARKVSPDATELRERLGDLYASERTDFSISDEGRPLFKFMTGRGRIGRRFAPRFWEHQSVLGRDREVMIVACKKWHVAKRLLSQIREKTDIVGVEYLFDEGDTSMPDLGGIEAPMSKRKRHHRALMRLLFEEFETGKMIICLDPGNITLIQDLISDTATTRLLDVECRFEEDYLLGHAKRVGLAGDMTSPDTVRLLLPAVRETFEYEADQIRAANLQGYARISERQNPSENATALATFLDVSVEVAQDVLSIDYLFED
ncbi:MAG: DUF5928 domain-containing protein [Litoreibacter sp.]